MPDWGIKATAVSWRRCHAYGFGGASGDDNIGSSCGRKPFRATSSSAVGIRIDSCTLEIVSGRSIAVWRSRSTIARDAQWRSQKFQLGELVSLIPVSFPFVFRSFFLPFSSLLSLPASSSLPLPFLPLEVELPKIQQVTFTPTDGFE